MKQNISRIKLSIARTAVIAVVFMAAVIALMAFPLDATDQVRWTIIAIGSKVMAIAGFYLTGRLMEYWKHDRWIAAYLRHTSDHTGREAGKHDNN